MDSFKIVSIVDETPEGVKFYYKLWKCLKKCLADDDRLGCHANNIIVHLGKSIESQYKYYDKNFDSWCDYFLANEERVNPHD